MYIKGFISSVCQSQSSIKMAKNNITQRWRTCT